MPRRTDAVACPNGDVGDAEEAQLAGLAYHADEPDSYVPDYDDSFPTVLRVLTQLGAKTRPRTEVADAVMHYVPGAVALGYLDDAETPSRPRDLHRRLLVDAASVPQRRGPG